VIIYNLANYTLLTYMPSYLSDSLGISDTAGLLLLFIAILVMLVVITFVGSFSDRVGRKPVLIGAMIGFVVLTFPAFLLTTPAASSLPRSTAPSSTLPICVTAPSSPYSDGRSAKPGLTSAFTTSVTLAPPCCSHRAPIQSWSRSF
jgi:MFS family permease